MVLGGVSLSQVSVIVAASLWEQVGRKRTGLVEKEVMLYSKIAWWPFNGTELVRPVCQRISWLRKDEGKVRSYCSNRNAEIHKSPTSSE